MLISSFALAFTAGPVIPSIVPQDKSSMILSKETSGRETISGCFDRDAACLMVLSLRRITACTNSLRRASLPVISESSITQAIILSLPNFKETSFVMAILLSFE